MPIETRVGKSGNKSFRARLRLKGYPEQSKSFKHKADARAWLIETESRLTNGENLPTDGKKKTVTDLIQRFIGHSLPHKPNNKEQLKVIQILNRWEQELGPIYVTKITPAHISEVKEKLLGETTYRGTLRSPATVNRYLATMSLCFKYAVRDYHWLDRSPMEKISRCQESSGRTRFLDDTEREKLLVECRSSRNPHLHLVVMLALSTGARLNEILSLTWPQIDFDKKTMMILETKNKVARTLPIFSPIADQLRERKKSKVRHTHFVFPNRTGDGTANIRNAFDAAVKRADIKDFRFHDLRHTAASYLALNGESLLTIKQILGHKTLAMVNRYAHLTEQHTFEAIERMNIERLASD